MKRGCLYIDGNDVYLQYGIYVIEGGWNELIAFPPLKSVESNDWQEEDGIEPDLSTPVLNTKEVQIKFAVSGLFSRYFDFLDMLSDGAYHTFECAAIKRTYTLRLTSQPNLEAARILRFATFKFANDYPMRDYNYKAPVSTVSSYDDYSIDGKLFTDYGCRILQGTMSEIEKAASVKTNLLRNFKTKAGASYDGRKVTYKSKDVKLAVLMRAQTLDELWRNYDALLFDLIRPDERLLWVNDIEEEFPCYYKNCSVTDFFPTGKIWLQFTLTMALTQGFRIGEGDKVLASEDNIVVFTENSDCAIEMLPDRFSIPSVRLVNDRKTLRFTANGKLRFNN